MPHPLGRPWIIAHRGASLRERENTLEAFRLAAHLGADAVELDVRRTADGVLVVHHDDTVAGADHPIIALTRTALHELAPWVPDLEEALAASSPMWVDVEVKNDPREADWDTDQRTVESIVALHSTADIVVTSFNPDAVGAAAAAGLRTGLLLGRGVDPARAAEPAAAAGHDYLLPHYSTLGMDGAGIVTAATAAGIEVAVWTVDDPAEMRRLAQLGVGGIATNAPEVALAALDVDHGNREGG